MYSVDAHINNRPATFSLTVLTTNIPILVIGDKDGNTVHVYLDEKQVDRLGDVITQHQSARKQWATAAVIDDQLLEVKQEENHGCAP